MINHYINLSCWNEIIPLLEHESSVFWCDSMSLKFITMVFGYNVHWKPGTEFVDEIIGNMDKPTTLILTPHKELKNHSAKIIQLPFYSDKIYLSDDLKLVLDEGFENIYIGISSPKQNFLAHKLVRYFPNSNIHCVGAAVEHAFDGAHQKRRLDASKTGFEWLFLLAKNPKRGMMKISQTLHGIYRIFRFSNTRMEFKKFASRLE